MSTTNTRTYLGAGVFGSYDGHKVTLVTSDGYAVDLPPEVLTSLRAWARAGYPDRNTGMAWDSDVDEI